MNCLYNVKTAAGRLSISHWTVRLLIKQGKLTPIRIGRRVLLEESELQKFILANRGSGNEVQK